MYHHPEAWTSEQWRFLVVDDNSRLIPLTQGKFAIVDAEDYEWVNQYKWHYVPSTNGDGYARRQRHRSFKPRGIFMHMEIMKAESGEEVDHWNNNGLDNRKQNLRKCTHQQNCHNKRGPRSKWGYFGVLQDPKSGRFTARILINRTCYTLGGYSTVQEAAIAFDSAAKFLRGDFAALNFPNLDTPPKSVEQLRAEAKQAQTASLKRLLNPPLTP